MFSVEPVERSSTILTSSPRARRRSAKCDPIKPAPPVIRTFIALPICYRFNSRQRNLFLAVSKKKKQFLTWASHRLNEARQQQAGTPKLDRAETFRVNTIPK